MWKNRCLIILLFFLFLPFAHAQNEKAAIPLKEILEQMSVQYDVKFNYIEEKSTVKQIPLYRNIFSN